MWSGKLIYYSMSSSFKATFLKIWGLIPFKILASNLVSFFYTCFIVGVPYIAPLVIYAVLAYYCPGVQAVDLTQGVTVLDMQEGFWGNPFLTNVMDRESPLPLTDILRVPGPHAIDPALESALIDQVSESNAMDFAQRVRNEALWFCENCVGICTCWEMSTGTRILSITLVVICFATMSYALYHVLGS